jgi:hypothetical protein
MALDRKHDTLGVSRQADLDLEHGQYTAKFRIPGNLLSFHTLQGLEVDLEELGATTHQILPLIGLPI